MLVCEAAGFDVVLVETVGVGQSETSVATMVDFFLALMIAGAGDELQGIKKGILEVADAIAINKADGENVQKAKQARQDYETAMHMITPETPTWRPPVLTCSSVLENGTENVWKTVLDHRTKCRLRVNLTSAGKNRLWTGCGILLIRGLNPDFGKTPR